MRKERGLELRRRKPYVLQSVWRSEIRKDFEGSARSDCEGSNRLHVWISDS